MDSYRPRGQLARAIFEKFHNDHNLDEYDTRQWYRLNEKLPETLQSKFLPLFQPDETTVRWLEHTKNAATNIWLHLWHAFARSILQFFMTQTDINGMLKRGSMYILSEDQFEKLLITSGFNVPSFKRPIKMLDVGAGDGEISMRLLKSLENMQNGSGIVNPFATETSWTMRERLKKRDFIVIDKISELQNVELISCLNVLDRCSDPYLLLQDIHSALAPDGRAILALVLPYTHYVEFNSSHLPLQPLFNHWPKKSLSFEQEAGIFLNLLESLGFRVEVWTKAPYLCEGDLHQSFYWLLDIVVVVSKKV